MIRQLYRSGKTPKFCYFAAAYLRRLLPRAYYRWRGRSLLRGWEQRPDADYIRSRVDFYCPDAVGSTPAPLAETADKLVEGRAQSTYYIDIRRWLRYFPADYRLDWQPGDVFENPPHPALIKARRLDSPGADNAVIINLNRVRHFIHPHDSIPFLHKKPQLLFRGKIEGKPRRIDFFRRYFGTPLCDIADTTRHPKFPEWSAPKMSIADHFAYQFIMVIEGNDVSSNLQWVMASNCVPVMARPKVEHWLMHSRLKPGVHYIEVADDFSDLEEKLAYYIAHPEEAETIARESQRWAQQFFKRKREKIITLLTLEKYFSLTGQLHK